MYLLLSFVCDWDMEMINHDAIFLQHSTTEQLLSLYQRFATVEGGGSGVHPPLELSRSMVRFRNAAVSDYSSTVVFLTNQQTAAPTGRFFQLKNIVWVHMWNGSSADVYHIWTVFQWWCRYQSYCTTYMESYSYSCLLLNTWRFALYNSNSTFCKSHFNPNLTNEVDFTAFLSFMHYDRITSLGWLQIPL